MDRLSEPQLMHQRRPVTAGDSAVAAAGHLALATVPAAWPAGVSRLAQHIDACQRSAPGQVGLDWLLRATRDLLTI